MSNNHLEQYSYDLIKEQILEALEEESQSFIFLTGAAGTGKSTMLEHIRNQSDAHPPMFY